MLMLNLLLFSYIYFRIYDDLLKEQITCLMLQEGVEWNTIQVLHHNVEVVIRFNNIVDLNNIEMTELL